MTTEQLPDGLQLAVALLGGDRDSFICSQIHPVSGLAPSDEEIATEYLTAIGAIRAEHAQRLTLQHHAADQAQRIADLIEVGDGRIQHTSMGFCPDIVHGHAIRDEHCPACRVLEAGENQREMIADALADARREGAEAMRADCAKIARQNRLHYGSGEPADEELAQAIEDLPLPTGPRQAVLLTDEQIATATRHLYACPIVAVLGAADDIETARAIEAAVLAANGLEVRRG